MATTEPSRVPDRVLRLEGKTLPEILSSLGMIHELEQRNLPALEVLFQEGETGNLAYLILDGSMHIETRAPGGGTRQLTRFGPGDLFGEMAILDEPQRSATARGGPRGATLLEIPREALNRIFTEAPAVARWLLKVLSHRLRVMNKMSREMEQVHNLNRLIIEGQESERRRIARDIHDGPAQFFADYIMRLQFIEKLVDRDLGQARGEMTELRESMGAGLDNLRALIHNLHLKDFKGSDLMAAIRKFVGRLGEGCPFEVHIEFEEGLAEGLDEHISNTLYCLVQEAMNNARKHSRAKHLHVRLQGQGVDTLRLEVQDDGVGFDVASLLASYHDRESLGLTSMQERAELASGSMDLQSQPGQGTTLIFDFPRERGAA